MRSLIEAAKAPDYPAQIALVLANRLDAGGVQFAQANGIKSNVIISSSFPQREIYERVLDESLRAANVSLVCLAGFMRILTPWFVERWAGRLINIHPSLLPSYKGLDTHARVLEDGGRIHGCTTHFVVPELDAGPIIMQAAVPVLPNDTEEALAARVLAQEHVIYPRTLAAVASGRAALVDGRCVLAEAAGGMAAAGALVSPNL
ncbi:MAG: phosphoribosylglycinamide formyltransferase [Beijerinckiaceae bacterium]